MTISEYRNYLKKNLEVERQNVLEVWASGGYTGPTADETVQLNARALGFVESTNVLLEYLDTEIEDDD